MEQDRSRLGGTLWDIVKEDVKSLHCSEKTRRGSFDSRFAGQPAG